MGLRKAAGLLVAAGLAVGLIGAGVSAQFTDSAVATTTIHVGTFNIDISSSAPGVVQVDGTSVTYTCPDIQSSAAGSCSFPFTLTNTGSIPATIAISATVPASPFTAVAIGPVAPIAGGAHVDLSGGLQWTELFNANLNQTVSVTYTISASA